MQVFEEAAALCGGSVSCFVNIGGASANYGTTAASLDFPNGLVMVPKVMSFDPARGLMFEYAAMGLPVVNLIDIRGIAMRNGIPVDPDECIRHMATASLQPLSGSSPALLCFWAHRRKSP